MRWPDVAIEPATLSEVATGPGRAIGRRLSLFESDGRRAVFFGATAIHVYDAGDREAQAACMATLSGAGLASDVDIAAGFGVHRNTVGRLVSRFERNGMAAVVPAKRGPKAPSKVTPEVMEIIAAYADLPRQALRDRIAEATGVSLSLPYVYELAAARGPSQLELIDAGGVYSSASGALGADDRDPHDVVVHDDDRPATAGEHADGQHLDGGQVHEVDFAASTTGSGSIRHRPCPMRSSVVTWAWRCTTRRSPLSGWSMWHGRCFVCPARNASACGPP